MKVLAVLAVVFVGIVSLACASSSGSPQPTVSPTVVGAAASPTPTPVISCPSPTPCPACPAPIPCPPAPTCPEPVTCPTCPTCSEPVVCPTCPEPVICADCPACPQTCPETRTGLTNCIAEKKNTIDLWVTCDQELRDCQAALPGQQVNCFELMQYASLLELQISMCLDRPCTYEHEQLAIIETVLNAYCR